MYLYNLMLSDKHCMHSRAINSSKTVCSESQTGQAGLLQWLIWWRKGVYQSKVEQSACRNKPLWLMHWLSGQKDSG